MLERKTRNSGSSGGIFGVIAKNLLKSGYVIYGAAFDNNLHLSHMRAEMKRTETTLLFKIHSK